MDNLEKLSKAQANLKITLWNAKAESITSSELYVKLLDLGLPEEVVTRLHEVAHFTKKIGDKTYSIGKSILIKIIEFVKEHPFVIAGASIGAIIGLAIGTLITSVPFLGQVLAPVAAILGITITFTGAAIGYRFEKQFPELRRDVTELIEMTFQGIANVFNTVTVQSQTA
ncbi:MAG: hypothetical protein GVY17_03070 [Cyanobacteria bacterium]|jgi:uncharacterized membrane protein|nr:hypothetical protein [Cyanobacteria bacterium GSL.Bin21]